MCDSPLAPAFPYTDATPVTDLVADVSLRALPTAFLLLAWLAAESRVRAPAPRAFRRLATGVGVAASLALGVVAWRTFDVLACADDARFGPWRVLAATGAPVVGLALTGVGRARVGVGLALLLGAATVAADGCVRALLALGVPTLQSAQHLWLLVAAVRLAGLSPARTSVAIASARATVAKAVDPLAARPVAGVAAGAELPERGMTRTAWSWFA